MSDFLKIPVKGGVECQHKSLTGHVIDIHNEVVKLCSGTTFSNTLKKKKKQHKTRHQNLMGYSTCTGHGDFQMNKRR